MEKSISQGGELVEFKLKFLFELYKDLPLPSRDKFRMKMKKLYGDFKYTNELIYMIENYQLKKFGCTLYSYDKGYSKEEALKIQDRITSRNHKRRRK